MIASYLIGLMCSSRGDLALLARSKLSKVTVVVTLPTWLLAFFFYQHKKVHEYAHLVVEDLGLARLGLRDEGIVEDVEDILADLLKLCLDLLSVVANGANVLLRALGLFLLLNRGDDTPGRASSTDNVLVGDREKVALVNGQFTADLQCVSLQRSGLRVTVTVCSQGGRMWRWHTLATSYKTSQSVSANSRCGRSVDKPSCT